MLTGQEFKNLIRGSGFNLRDVAWEGATSESSLSQWCNGIRDIRVKTYKKYTEAYERLLARKTEKQLKGIEFKQLAIEAGIALQRISIHAIVGEKFLYDWTNGTYKHHVKWSTYDKILQAFDELKGLNK